MQATETCKKQEASCRGGESGPPSPRRAEPSPFYKNHDRLNRTDGPEDRSLAERCMAREPARLRRLSPHRAGAWRGRNLLRHRTRTGVATRDSRGRRPAAPSRRCAYGGATREAGGRATRWWLTSRTSDRRRTTAAHARTCIWSSVSGGWTPAPYGSSVAIEDPTTWTRPWTVRQELTAQDVPANRIYYSRAVTRATSACRAC